MSIIKKPTPLISSHNIGRFHTKNCIAVNLFVILDSRWRYEYQAIRGGCLRTRDTIWFYLTGFIQISNATVPVRVFKHAQQEELVELSAEKNEKGDFSLSAEYTTEYEYFCAVQTQNWVANAQVCCKKKIKSSCICEVIFFSTLAKCWVPQWRWCCECLSSKWNRNVLRLLSCHRVANSRGNGVLWLAYYTSEHPLSRVTLILFWKWSLSEESATHVTATRRKPTCLGNPSNLEHIHLTWKKKNRLTGVVHDWEQYRKHTDGSGWPVRMLLCATLPNQALNETHGQVSRTVHGSE